MWTEVWTPDAHPAHPASPNRNVVKTLGTLNRTADLLIEKQLTAGSRPTGNPNALRMFGGAERDRTVDLLNAIQALSQLSYSPTKRARIYPS